MKPEDNLRAYRGKRDFSKTAEPSGEAPALHSGKTKGTASFVVQKHWASRLHYDFRLELDGTLKSWAVPKGPCLDPGVKRMAIQVEDHPLAYGEFEGAIPKGEYGAGKVIIWDKGQWESATPARQAFQAGKLKFTLHGSKLQGRWALIRTRNDTWLLIKEKDGFSRAESDYDITKALPGRWTDSWSGKQTDMPKALSPALATRVSAPPTGDGWSYELKFDGYRILTRMLSGKARLFTRSGHDWTDHMPSLARVFESNPLPDGWYDGEIVVLDAAGKPDFQALQNAFELGSKPSQDLVYFLFDLPWWEQQDLRQQPLHERRARLNTLLQGTSHPALRLSEVFDVPAQAMLNSACELGLEGVIGKRRNSPYTAGRSGHWIKLKCGERQEFVIGGYTEPQGGRSGFGALLLGHYDEQGALRYAGKVGSGFNEATLAELRRKLDRLPSALTPFTDPPREPGVHWVGKIFIDYLRNGFGATTVSAWSLRARPGMGISVPINWDEIEAIECGNHWTLQNIDERLDIGNSPWKGYADAAVALGPAMQRLG